MNDSKKEFWDDIYQTKSPTEVSWFQPIPKISLDFFKEFQVPTSANIIDIGGGDSLLVDHLMDLGYTDISVLDISEKAITKAKNRLNDHSQKIKWIISDITQFEPLNTYDVWHDRATFHFLTEEKDIQTYISIIQRAVHKNGLLIIGTFSEQGPTKCSGLPIKQYSEESMAKLFEAYFTKLKCIQVNHHTPFDTVQHFTFCVFRKKT